MIVDRSTPSPRRTAFAVCAAAVTLLAVACSPSPIATPASPTTTSTITRDTLAPPTTDMPTTTTPAPSSTANPNETTTTFAPATTTTVPITPVTTIPTEPPPRLALTGVVQLAAGYDHTCATVRAEPAGPQSVVCWGSNSRGQLGGGTTGGRSSTPVPVVGLPEIGATGDLIIAGGGDHTCAVVRPSSARSSLWCWGSNDRGQLGVAGIPSSNRPVTVPGITYPVTVTAGRDHTCVTEDPGGTPRVKCWGNGDSGQTGVPVRTGILLNVSAYEVVAGADHTCALTQPGTLPGGYNTAKCWGSNLESQLGSGPSSPGGPRARRVFAPRDLIAISTRLNHTCGTRGIGLDASVICWGSNFAGQLGTEGPNPPIPVVVPGVASIVERRPGNFWVPATGGGHSCVSTFGTPGSSVACWGLNANGQLGNGSRTSSAAPAAVAGLTHAWGVVAGLNHSCAVTEGRFAACWGQNDDGQLGNGTTTDVTAPVNVIAPAPPQPPAPPPPSAELVSAGSNFSCAVVGSGSVRCWGFNSSGQLGNNDTREQQSPVVVRDLTDATQVSAGGAHSCAVRRTGQVACWGSNRSGQLGDGTTDRRLIPVNVPGITDAVQVSAANNHTCAVRRTGHVSCWGDNFAGKLGDGTDDSLVPSPVEVLELDDTVQVAAGGDFTCALRRDGTVRCWGSDVGGTLGNGGGLDTPLPAPVLDDTGVGGTLLGGVTRITADASHACALIGDGTARCWGVGDNGELGTGASTGSNAPTAVAGLRDATWIDAGRYHTCAVLSDGSGRCWGRNEYRAIGNGGASGAPDELAPVPVVNLRTAAQVTAGGDHTCGRTTSGNLQCWGSDLFGQLGNGPRSGSSSTPVPVVGF